ncbi:TonB-dependent receptor [Mucilaginibacter myungsuensis]|uniref:TonB-dependent receptor n=1 Tax=Mucilaginibacter myungsuensis TaxID=649104 RepID=A0A929PXZ7_9SPHI|nr:TonB-dependent receptor [Mucilaginibacter myungsuensis]MBE9662797.1 TonB-dependent receptor [Mucilaginibacter myungsuensis]MDN3598217.1 TonB-dependent receptor [Mucilaginibacter myungsuensis]
MNKLYATLFFALPFCTLQAQTTPQNDTDTLKTISVRSYLFSQPVFKIPAAVSILSPAQLKMQTDNSMVSSMNTIPGVKMEERSPGSYRLSLRGSLLRSPFGVRDVKVYFDDIPLTDAGGNTYLNALDINSLKSIEVLKGPDGSLFGANSGGVVILRPTSTNTDNYGRVGFNGGSYNLLHQNAAVQNVNAKNQFNFDQSYQSYGGYRDHSYMRRHYFQAVNKISLSEKDQLKVIALHADLKYQTPGGITLAQMNTNPRLSRQATPTLPSAITQDIQISTKVLLGGIINEAKLTDHLKNVTSLSVMHVDFANPFITNYEQRMEDTYSLRSYLELDGGQEKYLWKLDAGLEWQRTNSSINNYANNQGVRGNEQKLDKINSGQHFFFSRYSADIFTKLHVEAALSLNYYGYYFKNIFPLAQSGFTPRKFTPQLMPRVALSYEFLKGWAARASLSRGYSTPTTAEVRPTDNIINTDLQAQTGWNYEAGIRMHNADNSLTVDASVFNYRISNAIVRRLHPDDTEFYINAGGTDQTGVEVAASDWLIRPKNYGFVRGLQLNTAYTLSRYFFRNYSVGATNYSGNPLTGVPRHVIVSSVQVKLPQSVYAFVQHNYTAGIPLNDANTVFAPQYHLLQAKAGWSHALSAKTKLELYAGADNLLNQRYSLGNDLNAVGNRYYNPSPLRNYYAGLNVTF